MGQKILPVSVVLIDNLVRGTEIHCKIERAVPDNAKLIKLGLNKYDSSIIEFYYECPDWNDEIELATPPYMEPIIFIDLYK